MPSIFDLVIIVAPILTMLLLIDYRMNKSCTPNVPIAALDQTINEADDNDNETANPNSNATVDAPKAFSSSTDSIYLIVGDAGFLGAWIARYLILRGNSYVLLASPVNPPLDVIRHGASHCRVDLASNQLADELSQIVDKSFKSAPPSVKSLVVFNCSYMWWMSESFKLRVARAVVDVCANREAYLIHIDGIKSHSVSWWRFWDYRDWVQVTEDTCNSSGSTNNDSSNGSSTRSAAAATTNFSSSASCEVIFQWPKSACIYIDGFLSGHLNDSFLSPALHYQGGLLHSWNVPISLFHVEDAVRAALLAEYALMDPLTSSNAVHQRYVVSSNEITTLGHVYAYLSSKTEFRAIQVQPVLAYLVSAAMTEYHRLRLKLGWPLKISRKQAALLCGSARTLTIERFNLLQIGRIPNPVNSIKAENDLHFVPRFTIKDIVQTTINEHEIMLRRSADRI